MRTYNIYLKCLIVFVLMLSSSMSSAEKLSTTKDGMFQAIAQGPNSITVYWKGQGESPALYVNGQMLSDYKVSIDPVSGFSHINVCSLKPNTAYTFSLGQNGPAVLERTWSEIPSKGNYDLLIIDATASGTAAAITAARLGMRVALVDETNRVGGMASNGLGSTDMRYMTRSSGVFEDFRRRVIEYYGHGEGRFYESRLANAIFKDIVYQYPNINLFMKAEFVKPIMSGKKVCGAVIRDIASGRTGEIFASVTIDASYTGDFAAAAGVPYRAGREARSPQEPHAGVIYFDNAKQELLPGSTGEADCKQQSYAYLMIWKDYGENGAPLIEKPRFYSPDIYEYSPEWKKTWNFLYGRLTSNKYEINQHPFGIDWPGINHDYPTASKERRQEIAEMYRDRALGYLYFMQNERGHNNLGLSDDEFLDNGNFPHSLYVRECKRIMGEYLFNESDVSNARQFHRVDSIGIGDYPMDSHATEDLKDPARIDKGEGEAWLKSFTPWYQIPYGVLVPKCVDNLLVSTAVSSTHWGYGALRMEPARFAMGQAAGAAAYWSVLYGKSPRDINPAWVQDKIQSQYSYINWNSDVTRDTRHFEAINFLAARGVFGEEEFKPDEPLTQYQALLALNRMLLLEGSRLGFDPAFIADPDVQITRGLFAVWLVAAKQMVSCDWQNVTPDVPRYSDVPKDSPFYTAVETLNAHRINSMLFENPEIGMYKPDASISRGDAAEAIYLAHRSFAMNYWMP